MRFVDRDMSIGTLYFKLKHCRLVKQLCRFGRNEDGVGAVEFAMVVPLLLALYVGSLELSVAMSVDKKISKSSAVVADIIAQSESTNRTTLLAMYGVAQSVMAPFDASSLTLEIVGIDIDSSGTSKIAWSWDEQNGTAPQTAGAEITIPSSYLIPNTFLLKATIRLPYQLQMLSPGHASVEWKNSDFTMGNVYYLHQREVKVIACSDC